MATNFVHGVTFQDTPTNVLATVAATAGMNVVFGLAPVHTLVGGSANVNTPLLCNNINDCASQVGIQVPAGLWSQYTITEHVDCAFIENNIRPVVYVNVLNPAIHKTIVAQASMNITASQVSIVGNAAYSVILDSVLVQNSGKSVTYVLNTDYTLGYDVNGNCVLTVLSTGAIGAATSLQVGYSNINPSAVTSSLLIGGVDGNGNYSGLFCVELIYPLFSLVPAILLAPGWSQIASVAAAMLARGLSINNCFVAESFVDIDATAVTQPSQANAWKNTNNIVSPHQVLCWPMIQLAGSPNKIYHLSTALAVSCATIDANNNGIPYVSPSNKTLEMTGAVLASGASIIIAKPNADLLNSQGIVTVLNMNGWRAWGNLTAAYPGDSDPHDMWIPVRRMFDWVGNTLILTIFQEVDNPANLRLIQTVTETVNLWLNSLVAAGALLGARITFNPDDNPIANLLNGTFVFHVYLGGVLPAQNINFKLTFDTSYLSVLFTANPSVTGA